VDVRASLAAADNSNSLGVVQDDTAWCGVSTALTLITLSPAHGHRLTSALTCALIRPAVTSGRLCDPPIVRGLEQVGDIEYAIHRRDVLILFMDSC